MEDSSLDEFVSGDEGGTDDGDAEAARSGRTTDAEPVDTARTTSRWTPEGVVCAGCGETVRRCWRADDECVCRSCKEW